MRLSSTRPWIQDSYIFSNENSYHCKFRNVHIRRKQRKRLQAHNFLIRYLAVYCHCFDNLAVRTNKILYNNSYIENIWLYIRCPTFRTLPGTLLFYLIYHYTYSQHLITSPEAEPVQHLPHLILPTGDYLLFAPFQEHTST